MGTFLASLNQYYVSLFKKLGRLVCRKVCALWIRQAPLDSLHLYLHPRLGCLTDSFQLHGYIHPLLLTSRFLHGQKFQTSQSYHKYLACQGKTRRKLHVGVSLDMFVPLSIWDQWKAVFSTRPQLATGSQGESFKHLPHRNSCSEWPLTKLQSKRCRVTLQEPNNRILLPNTF